MPFQPFNYLPGFYTEGTRKDSYNRFIDGNHTRFYKGFPKKVGGSQKTSNRTFLGFCRGLVSWVTLIGIKYVALGTHLKLYVYRGGTFYDITPLRASGTLAPDPISTVDTSAIVTIESSGHNVNVGDYVSFSGATAVGGITINGEYTVTTIVDVNSFTITASSAATSTATGGGSAVDYEYQIHIGYPSTFLGGGWGTGTWDTGAWSTPRSTSLRYARTWSIHPYGEDLIASPRDEGIFRWLGSGDLATRAAILSNAPITNKQVVVSSEDRYLIALGAHDGIDSDPMLIRWSSQDNANDWTPTTTNTAGDKRLSLGNQIVCGVISRGQVIIATDTALFAMYPDSTFIFGFKTLGLGGCIGPNAMIEYNGVVYFMGINDFYQYDGIIKVMRCDVKQYVFTNIDRTQGYKVYAGVNSLYNELWWFYQDTSGSDCNRYVAYDVAQDVWHYGSWDRTAWIDRAEANNTPLATGTNNYLYAQETGLNDDGAILTATYTTGATQIESRNRFILINKIIPDFKILAGNMNIQVVTRLTPQDNNPITTTPSSINSTTPYICPRARGDEFQLIFTSAELGGDFQMGNVEIKYIETGVR
jgi:hypothetical protein